MLLVAPYMGAWIEISPYVVSICISDASLPTWERGLKLSTLFTLFYYKLVAPYMGAWIEIFKGKGPASPPDGRSLHGSVD